MKDQLKILRTNQDTEELKAYLADKEVVALDTETSGLTEESVIVGYSICAEPGIAYYVITREWNVATQELVELETNQGAPDVLKLLIGKKVIGHNFVFDAAMISRNYKVDLIESCFADTMVLAHLLDENRPKGLKDLGEIFYGAQSKKESEVMKESVAKNGGSLTKANYEMYKADSALLGLYGAKDAILTFSLFYDLMPTLFAEGLDKFFFEESMPLLRGPTYQLNTVGLKVDTSRLADLKKQLESEILSLKSFILKEIEPHIKDLYPGTTKKNTFNIGSNQQVSWLLFVKLENPFHRLSDSGKALCSLLELKIPYTNSAKRAFAETVAQFKGQKLEAKIRDYWTYLSLDEEALSLYADKYKWVASLLEYRKTSKLLSTYVDGIAEQVRYGIIHPSFLQTGTDGTRYSSQRPNMQNLPRKDKRIKECFVARPGKVFVGADYSQLEPRVFAYISKDKELTECFQKGQDFYSVVGIKVYDKPECSVYKKDPNFFGTLFPDLRDKTKIFTLSIVYGKSVRDIAAELEVEIDEAQVIVNSYLEKFPRIELMMLEAHENIKKLGYAVNMFGRKRRVPEALDINRIYPNVEHKELPYKIRTLLNLGCNYPIQGTAGSVANRSSIRFDKMCKEANIAAPLVCQVHDSLIVECNEADAEVVSLIMKECMENTVTLEGVPLEAVPKIGNNFAEL